MRKGAFLLIIGMLAALLMPAAGFGADGQAVLDGLAARWARDAEAVKDLKIESTETLAESGGVIEATTYIKGENLRIETTMRAPEKSGEGNPGEVKTTMIMGPKGAWMISPMLGKMKMDMKEFVRESRKYRNSPALPADAVLRGEETVGGRECHVIDAGGGKDAVTMWVDKNDGSLVKLAQGKKKNRIEVINADFRKIGGFSYPYRAESLVDGKLISTRIVRKLALNKGVSDQLFDADQIKGESVDMKKLLKGLGGKFTGMEE